MGIFDNAVYGGFLIMYITTVFTRGELETMLAGGVVVYTGKDGISRQCEMEHEIYVRQG